MTRCSQKSTKSAEWMADRIAWDVKAENVWGVEGVGIRGGAYSQQSRSWRACFIQAAREGAGGQGRHYLYQPAAFEPGAAHRGLPAGRCCGGRHGAGAHKGRRSAARRPQPRAQPGGRRPPPWGGQAAWIQLHSPCFQDFLNDERDRNETEAPTLKLYVFIVHSLLHIDRSINVMSLVGGSCDSRRVLRLITLECLSSKRNQA